jgi:predicted dienelactone hydrolase
VTEAATKAVGCRAMAVVDPVQGAPIPLHLLYPSPDAARPEKFQRYTLEVARDGTVAGAGLPLVAISHGKTGTPWGYHGLAMHLALAGFCVAMIEHPGDSRADASLDGTPANLANRPRHVRLAIDAALAHPAIGPSLAGDRAAVIGHSIGGYTALAAAGGRPMALPDQTPDGLARPVPVEPDERIRAIVLLAPALPWFMAHGALADVAVPVLVRTGAEDTLSPPYFVERILSGLPSTTPIDYRVVPGAGHFAFFGPIPPELVGPGFPPSIDPPGFVRDAYLPVLFGEVEAFLRSAA